MLFANIVVRKKRLPRASCGARRNGLHLVEFRSARREHLGAHVASANGNELVPLPYQLVQAGAPNSTRTRPVSDRFSWCMRPGSKLMRHAARCAVLTRVESVAMVLIASHCDGVVLYIVVARPVAQPNTIWKGTESKASKIFVQSTELSCRFGTSLRGV